MNNFGRVLVLSICVVIVLKIKINSEEKLLTEHFGKEYLDFTTIFEAITLRIK